MRGCSFQICGPGWLSSSQRRGMNQILLLAPGRQRVKMDGDAPLAVMLITCWALMNSRSAFLVSPLRIIAIGIAE
jgi:hypothetical protein